MLTFDLDIEGKLSEQKVGRELFTELGESLVRPEFINVHGKLYKMMKDIFVERDRSAVSCLVS